MLTKTFLSILAGMAIIGFAAPSYAQYGSGSSYGNNNRTVDTQADLERKQRRAERKARKEAEKRAKAEALKQEALAKEAAMKEDEG